jgi:ribosomal protein S18 acetylase RimI-like enzyme
VTAGFTPLLPEGFQFPVAEEARIASRIAEGRGESVLGLLEGEPRAYVTFGPSRDPETTAEVGEVWTLNVHPSAWRRGFGRALVAHALERLTEQGFTEVTVWSFDRNERANSLYGALGFERDGRERREEAWADILEVRYRRPLP